MGVVYKAEDTKLERTVALKFLAAHLLNDEEAKARFLREAKAAAGLHHPNIGPVHEIGEADGKTFLSMAFIKGESLEARIERGPLPLKEALDIGRQVAEGLEAAHEKGVVHRDIKPANVMVDAKGRATIMDFGLARLTEASRLTKADQTMGTAAYMSPEQAQGMEVDSRSDIWALGVVLYEMVRGQRPFRGEYDQALLFEIVHQEPEPLTGVRAGVPMELEFIAGKCLAKDPADRYGNASEIAKDLRTLAEKLKSGQSTILRTGGVPKAVPATMTAAHTLNPAEILPPGALIVQRKNQRALQAMAGIATLAFLSLLAFNATQAPPEPLERTVRRFSLAPEGLTQAHISPDGKHILYAAGTGGGSSLWLRSLSDESARELPGTEGAIAGIWAPDSSSIGFAVGAPAHELKRISIDGGSPITLCDLPSSGFFMGGAWSPDGERIVFSSGLQLYEIAARGGQPQLLFDASDGDRRVSLYPHFLPATAPPALVYSAARTPADRWVAVLNLETGERRELGPGTAPVYSQDGYLIHGAASSAEPGLWALPFSLSTLDPTGDAFPISTAGFAPSVSHDGTLAYRTAGGWAAIWTLAWRNRAGEIIETVGQPQEMAQPALSPDGRRVAVRSNESGNSDIWVHDLTRSTKTRLTFDEKTEAWPTWSPSGKEITYRAGSSLMRKAADGTGEAVVIVQDERPVYAPGWSPDGRYLVYNELNGDNGRDISYVEIQPDGSAGEPVTFVGAPASERSPNLSPDGRFLAFSSDEAGRAEIYVRPFPDGPGRWQVSVDGGVAPRWRSDGKELYYLHGDTMMAVSVSTESAFTLGHPQPLFEVSGLGGARSGGGYDVSADGQRFLTMVPAEADDEETAPPAIRVVENWHEEFRDRDQD